MALAIACKGTADVGMLQWFSTRRRDDHLSIGNELLPLVADVLLVSQTREKHCEGAIVDGMQRLLQMEVEEVVHHAWGYGLLEDVLLVDEDCDFLQLLWSEVAEFFWFRQGKQDLMDGF